MLMMMNCFFLVELVAGDEEYKTYNIKHNENDDETRWSRHDREF